MLIICFLNVLKSASPCSIKEKVMALYYPLVSKFITALCHYEW